MEIYAETACVFDEGFHPEEHNWRVSSSNYLVFVPRGNGDDEDWHSNINDEQQNTSWLITPNELVAGGRTVSLNPVDGMNRPPHSPSSLETECLKKSKKTQKRILQFSSYPNNRILSFRDDYAIDIFRRFHFRSITVWSNCIAQRIQ